MLTQSAKLRAFMRTVEQKILIKTRPERVISAFTDTTMLKGWWGVEKSLVETHSGGCYTLAWQVSKTGFSYVSTGVIKSYESHSHLIVENMVYLNPERPFLGPMTLTIKVKPVGDQTELYLRQDGYQSGPDWDWYYEAVVKAWPMALEQLKTYLEQ